MTELPLNKVCDPLLGVYVFTRVTPEGEVVEVVAVDPEDVEDVAEDAVEVAVEDVDDGVVTIDDWLLSAR